ncbi:MAG: restriction endonuclease subunit S [Phascolarctobacterium sp.]|nr:restriction endonuclease subunit S [Phascolarctobacterium sp.]
MVRLGDVCKIISGYAFKSEEFITDGVPVIRISNLDGETVNVDKNVCYSVEFLKNNDNFIVRKNDILMAMSGATVGKIGVYPNEYVALLNQRVCNLKPVEDKLNREYLNCYCQSDYFKSEILKNAFGCAQPNISVKQIADFEIKILDLKSQVSIANKLKNILCLIEKRKLQLHKLDELVKARFVDMFGNPVRNEKNWDTVLLQDVCDGIGDGLHGTPNYVETAEYPFINGNNLIGGKIVVTDTTKFVDEAEYGKYYIELSPNAILLSINGTLGKLALYRGEKIVLGKSACYCNLKSNMNRQFVYNLMQTESFLNFLEENSTRSTIKNVGLKAIRNFRMIIPPLELQWQFSVFVKQIDKSKLDIQKSLDKLETLKKALMQKYFG